MKNTCLCWAVCQEHVVPTEQGKLSRWMHQRTRRQHCHHPLQQPHLPHWCHWVEQITQRHLHFDGWHCNYLCGLLQVRLLFPTANCFCVCVCVVKYQQFGLHTNPTMKRSVGSGFFFFVFSVFPNAHVIACLFVFLFNSKNYGITIKEMDQPLLLHRPKERSRQGGKVKTYVFKKVLFNSSVQQHYLCLREIFLKSVLNMEWWFPHA